MKLEVTMPFEELLFADAAPLAPLAATAPIRVLADAATLEAIAAAFPGAAAVAAAPPEGLIVVVLPLTWTPVVDAPVAAATAAELASVL